MKIASLPTYGVGLTDVSIGTERYSYPLLYGSHYRVVAPLFIKTNFAGFIQSSVSPLPLHLSKGKLPAVQTLLSILCGFIHPSPCVIPHLLRFWYSGACQIQYRKDKKPKASRSNLQSQSKSTKTRYMHVLRRSTTLERNAVKWTRDDVFSPHKPPLPTK